MRVMSTISLTLVLLALQASCWSRRRRTGDETSVKRFRKAKRSGWIYCVAKTNHQLPFCNLSSYIPSISLVCDLMLTNVSCTFSVTPGEVHIANNHCLYTRKSEMCGIQLSCSCCYVPTFG